MTFGLDRLRWQLTVSHLIAIAFTLVSMIAAMLIIGSSWIARQSDPADEPARDALVVANTIEGLVARSLAGSSSSGADAAGLSSVLRSLVTGDLKVESGPPFAPEQSRYSGWFGTSLDNLAYIAVVGRNGQVIASSDPSGASFAPPERTEWAPLVERAFSGERDPGQLVVRPSGNEPAALGAYPVQAGGRVVAAVLVAETAPAPAGGVFGFARALILFSAATIVVLAGSLIFALASSSLVGYLLARRLVGRLERLGRAAEALAAGDLSQRVDEGPADEVGQLARQFNRMAEQLSATVAELGSEKRHAESALRTKRELVANVSHELRTPLASIRGHVESLLMRGGNSAGDAQQGYLSIIHRETEHLSSLIEDLFALSTAEAGALSLVIEPVPLGDAIDEVTSSVRSAARTERGITVVTEVAPDLPPALADRQRVVQILGNLLRNALRHTPEGGLIAVRALSRDGRAVVTVEDTGAGIAPDQLPHVFERFYRGDAARDRASGGAGLGLAIVRELVEAMGGTVAAESVVGQGSRFSFTLPLSTEARQ